MKFLDNIIRNLKPQQMLIVCIVCLIVGVSTIFINDLYWILFVLVLNFFNIWAGLRHNELILIERRRAIQNNFDELNELYRHILEYESQLFQPMVAKKQPDKMVEELK